MKWVYLFLGIVYLPIFTIVIIYDYLTRTVNISFKRIFKCNWGLYWSDWFYYFGGGDK